MAWFFAMNGGSVALEGGVEVEKTEAYKALQEIAKMQGFILKTSYDEDGVTHVFIGKELYARRHLYVGETVVMDSSPLDENIQFVIKDALGALLQESGVAGEVGLGFVLNQFD